MCGIIGYAGGGNAAKIIYEGLKNLEYRGYDSAGAALLDGGRITVLKRRGTVDKLQPLLADKYARIGIGHTRWATHGKPSDVNAHPHICGDIAVVHNGIIENYAELKEGLLSRGARFLSETDSEVIAALLSENYSGDIVKALYKTVGQLKGSYAVMAICESENVIAVAKYKSPVIIGYGDGENYCASDEPVLAGKCANISVLKDGDIARVAADGVTVFDGKLQPVKRDIIPNTATEENLELGDCPHYMLKELRACPATIKNTLSAVADMSAGVRAMVKNVDRVIFIGCGTAYHAGLVGKYYVENLAKIPAEAETAGEFRYKNPIITPHTLVVAVSQSGETADTLEGAELAAGLGATVIAVTNSPHSRLTRVASAVVPVAAGAEICVAATKSYIGQIIALRYLAELIAGRDAGGLYAETDRLVRSCSETIESVDLYALAHLCALSHGVYFLGRGVDYAVALEASLKLKEVSYISSEGYPSGELKHGTLAMIDGGTVCVFLATDEGLAGKCANAVEQVLSRGGIAAIITHIKELKDLFAGRALVVDVPECGELSPVVTGVAVQYLAYKTAVLRGNNPDKPRNLAKSVTVE